MKDEQPTEKPPAAKGNGEERDGAFRFEDRRRWAQGSETEPNEAQTSPRTPTLIDEYRERAESAEQKLQEYIEAFKEFRREQDSFRERLGRDVDRRVELKFGSLVHDLLEILDNLDRALEHVQDVPEAAELARGVELARNSFLETLERNGVERVEPHGAEFDPNESEAVRLDAVDDPRLSGKVTEVVRPGYRLGERIVRPARVAVGRHDGP
ncbi:MAG TPA: nucleotide exchange factor GrpE [Candidatus Polarisedimenticolaceae bacterium]|nr:nucleotide exchange factor GrpE [Candidatus Polarisedimenticolaceae bacterium]